MPYRRPALVVALVAAAYWALLFVLTHAPLSPPGAAAGADKLFHAGAYGLLALLLCAAAAGFGKFNLATCLALFGLLALYGAVDELTQGLTHSRFPDAWDLAADLVGAALGMLLFAIGWQFFRQRPTA